MQSLLTFDFAIKIFGALLAAYWITYFVKGRMKAFDTNPAAKLRAKELRETELKLEECHKSLEQAHADVSWHGSRKSLLLERASRLRLSVAADQSEAAAAEQEKLRARVKTGSGQVPPYPMPAAHPATIIDGYQPRHPSGEPSRPDLGEFTNEPREGAKVTRVTPPANP